MHRRIARGLRIALSLLGFGLFFALAPLIGLVILPALRLAFPERSVYRRRSTRVLGALHAFFVGWLRFARLVEVPSRVPSLAGVAPGEACLVICNHPSLLDVVVLLAAYRDLTCVVKRSWYGTLALGPLLRQSAYLPGPERAAAADGETSVLDAMVRHLRAGTPLLVFPEGTRSLPTKMHRFRRGAVEAAVRARVPIVALFLATDRPFLTRDAPLWRVPSEAVRYELELLEVIDTRSLPAGGAAALNARLQARYQARFAEHLRTRGDSGSALTRSRPLAWDARAGSS